MTPSTMIIPKLRELIEKIGTEPFYQYPNVCGTKIYYAMHSLIRELRYALKVLENER